MVAEGGCGDDIRCRIFDAFSEMQPAERVAYHRLEKCVLQRRAVQHAIGCAPAAAGHRAHRQGEQRGKRFSGGEFDADRFGPARLDIRQYPERGENAGGIGGKLQAGANFRQFAGLFDDVTVDTVPGKRKGSGETGDAGTDNGYGCYGHGAPRSEKVEGQAAFTWKTQPGGLVCSAFSDGL
ncbi:hypothetical protein D3C72_1425650 [compost metagenome]